jgi:hypothetical protein
MDEVRSYVRLDLPSGDGKADPKMFRLVLESHTGRAFCAESEEKHEPVSDIDTVLVDSLKALDLNRPIREADIALVLYSAFDQKETISRVALPLPGLRQPVRI